MTYNSFFNRFTTQYDVIIILFRKIQFYRHIFYTNDCVLHKLCCALMSSDSMYDKCVISVSTRDTATNTCVQFRADLTDWCGLRTDTVTLFYFFSLFYLIPALVFSLIVVFCIRAVLYWNFCRWRIRMLIVIINPRAPTWFVAAGCKPSDHSPNIFFGYVSHYSRIADSISVIEIANKIWNELYKIQSFSIKNPYWVQQRCDDANVFYS